MDAEVEPRDPAEADWLDRQRRWTQGRRRFVVPTAFLVYLLYVAGGVAHYNDGAAVIFGEVILVAFAGAISSLSPGVRMPARDDSGSRAASASRCSS